jgi:hypothetical protein
MYTKGNEPDSTFTFKPGYATVEVGRWTNPSGHPFHGLASISRDIMVTAQYLPDAELLRIAGVLRTLADEVMAVVDRRGGARPAVHLVVDNTRR